MVAPGSFVAQRVLGQLELLGVLPDVAKVADSLTREENREGRERKGEEEKKRTGGKGGVLRGCIGFITKAIK